MHSAYRHFKLVPMQRLACVFFAIVTSATPVAAEILPSFEITTASWKATQIVVAQRTGTSYRVVENWQGSLAIGSSLELPQLPIPPKIATSRVVLFVREADSRSWRSASDFGDLAESVVWLDGAKAFAKRQLSNPGPSEIEPYPLDEPKLRAKVAEIVGIKRKLETARGLADIDKRVAALVPLARMQMAFVRDEALTALGDAGPKALPALRAYLATETLYPAVGVKALARAAGKDAATELIAIVRDELGFWKTVTPTLDVGWWNGDRPDLERLRNRYSKLVGALWELRPLKATSARAPVTALRDYWRAHKALEDRSGLSQMSEAADDVLRELK